MASKSGMTTKGGKPSAKARKETGMKGKGKEGKYPIFSQKSCLSAVKLRHHAKGGPSASAVLAKASAWASRNNNAA